MGWVVALVLPGFIGPALGSDQESTIQGTSAIELVLLDPPSNPIALTLDRSGLIDTIPEADRRAAVLNDLVLTTLHLASLTSTLNACGAGWQADGFVPNCPGTWSAEQLNLWRMLTITPDNASVRCTSLAGLEEIADTLAGLGLVNDPADLISAIFGTGRLDPLLDAAEQVIAFEADAQATHPAVNTDGSLPISLQDLLTDLTELPVRFGPQEAHPGVLASGDSTTQVLTAGFEVGLDGMDQRVFNEGIDLCTGPRTMTRIQAGSMTPVAFDYDGIQVTGIAANPTVDLVLKLSESNTFIDAQTRSNSQTAPALPPGSGAVWQLSPWLLEFVVADAAYSTYGTRMAYLLYQDPVFTIDEAAFAIGSNDADHFPVISTQPGWLRTWTLFGLGDPPEAQYLWESLLEVVQQRLHQPDPATCGNPVVAEGSGNAHLALPGVPVGVTEQTLIDGLKPVLQNNEVSLIETLPAPGNLGVADVFLAGTVDDLYLFFVHPDDLAPTPYGYLAPGFFADPGLEVKVSTTDPLGSGDADHEKVALGAAAQTLYVQDEFGDVFRLDIDPAASDRVMLEVSGNCGIVFQDGFESMPVRR